MFDNDYLLYDLSSELLELADGIEDPADKFPDIFAFSLAQSDQRTCGSQLGQGLQKIIRLINSFISTC